MPKPQASITRRLIVTILVLESLAAIGLIVSVAHNESRVRYDAFDANLRAVSHTLLSNIQEDVNDGVRLDLQGQMIPAQSVFRATDEEGRDLGHEGQLPFEHAEPNQFKDVTSQGMSYRFFTIVGERIIDPETAQGIRHRVTITYGLPDARVRREVFAAVRTFAVSTLMLLGLTTVLIVMIVRALTRPIRALADSAERLSATSLNFDPPSGARKFVELLPLTKALETASLRLQQSFAQQKRFTSDAAHELKTDLAIVKSSLQLLTIRDRDNEEYKQGVLLGLEDLTRLERTVQKMLILARLEQSGTGENQPADVVEVLLEVVRQSEALAELKSLTLKTTVLERAMVPMNRDDLTLLCSNIVLNALQHTSADGVVEISSSISSVGALIRVTDTGEGIIADEAHLLFEPFYRSDPSRSRKSGGTGLGLSICKAICDRAGGSISIGNRELGGAQVTVLLPVLNLS